MKTARAESKAETLPQAVSRHAAAAIEGDQGGLDAVLRAHPALSIASTRGSTLILRALRTAARLSEPFSPGVPRTPTRPSSEDAASAAGHARGPGPSPAP